MKLDGNNALASASSYSFHRSTWMGSGVMAAGSAGCVGGMNEAKIRIGIEVEVGVGAGGVKVGWADSKGAVGAAGEA